jgi:tetratricopeptide (TPR) repeat protein
MRQLPSDKYNVAWFKLAEFVSRGERERALCLYKLLVHSFDDYALAAQLEGDILLAFNDTKGACQRYRDAAMLFKDAKRLIESAAVYEHILLLEVNSDDLISCIALYDQLDITSRMYVHCQQLCNLYIDLQDFDSLKKFLGEWSLKLTDYDKAQLHATIATSLIRNNGDYEMVIEYLKTTIQLLLADNSHSLLQSFLSTLEVLNEDYYWYAAEQIQER